MSRLEELQAKLSSMSDSQLQDLVGTIRKSRITKKIEAANKTTKATSVSAKSKLKTMLAGMSEEQIRDLLGGA